MVCPFDIGNTTVQGFQKAMVNSLKEIKGFGMIGKIRHKHQSNTSRWIGRLHKKSNCFADTVEWLISQDSAWHTAKHLMTNHFKEVCTSTPKQGRQTRQEKN